MAAGVEWNVEVPQLDTFILLHCLHIRHLIPGHRVPFKMPNFFSPTSCLTISDESGVSPPIELQTREAMACADADMSITGDDQDLWAAARSEVPVVKYYQASEMLPGKKAPLDELLRKQPAVLGVSDTCCDTSVLTLFRPLTSLNPSVGSFLHCMSCDWFLTEIFAKFKNVRKA